jgi:hypothetical protein
MRYLKIGAFVVAICLFSCNENGKHRKPAAKAVVTITSNPSPPSNHQADKEEIQNTMREMLSWSQGKNSIQLVPVLTDSKDSSCIGFDTVALEVNIGKLKATNFFSSEFIDNYKQIILTLDKEMKDKKFGAWSTGELPPFNFANDVDPWCDCQDVPYDTPDPYSLVEVQVVSLNNEQGDLYWKWGELDKNVNPDWKTFKYKFKVQKEDVKWKISYLEGFDFKESIKS